MPMFMDVHTIKDGVKPEDVAKAHAEDLRVQGTHGVKFVKYWVDEKAGKIFCLSHAPSKEAAIATHRDAHGLMADDIFEVTEHS